ncbi:hypothetical protein ACOMHN_040419 [Nucella lapillus]
MTIEARFRASQNPDHDNHHHHQYDTNTNTNPHPHHHAYSLLQLLHNATTTPSPLLNATSSSPPGMGAGSAGERWAVLGLLSIIVCSVVGNVLVCLAVCWERRLQNMTNYFLMSLAIADLLVSVVVMPLGMIVELFEAICITALPCTPLPYASREAAALSVMFSVMPAWGRKQGMLHRRSIFCGLIHLCLFVSLVNGPTWRNCLLGSKGEGKRQITPPGFAPKSRDGCRITQRPSSTVITQHVTDMSELLPPPTPSGSGYFPLEPEVCVVWVSSDVLMCTASIWHMCTMSMDRYFTLKYPMRYGRNKTKTMVIIKIFFVWVVSMAISSPICIHGFLDPSIVYNHGVCMPVLKDFVIYGSVFAFYVPLLIMIVTYLLTLHILWKNQRTMRSITQADMRPRLAQMTAQCSGFVMPSIPTLISPDSKRMQSRPAASELVSGLKADLLMPPPAHPLLSPSSPQTTTSVVSSEGRLDGGGSSPRVPQHSPAERGREMSDSEEEELDLPSTHLLQDKSMSYKSLCTRAAMANSTEEFFDRASPGDPFLRLSPSEKSGSLRDRRSKTNQDLGSQASHRRGRALYSTASDTQLPSSSCSPSQAARPTFHKSFNGLETDYKSAEWDRRFFEIQQEMDACLRDAAEGGGDSAPTLTRCSAPNQKTECSEDYRPKEKRLLSEEGKRRVRNARTRLSCNTFISRQYKKIPRSKSENLSRSVPNTPFRRREADHTSDSDNEPETSGSSNSDMITIRLHPPTSPHREQHSASEDLTETSVLPSVLISSEADNTHEESDALNTNDESLADSNDHVLRRIGKHKRLLKARFRNTLRNSARPMFKHLLSKKTASNERKASKVLGIIFLVFVILWTPFFIVNIMSVTCKDECMQGLTSDMMSVFIWMGYVASLANPIIYTMFNTAFRRTFIHILTCRINRARRMKFSDLPTFPSMTTTMPPSDRRGTMTIVLDHRTC